MDVDDIRWRPLSVLWLVLILLGAFFFMVNVFQINSYNVHPGSLVLQMPSESEAERLKGFLIRTSGCRIPDMEAFDHTILKYINKVQPPTCNKGLPPLVEANLTSLRILRGSFDAYLIKEPADLNCCYASFARVIPKAKEADNKVKYSKDCLAFTNDSVDVHEEFVRVICKYNETEIYKDFFAFIPVKPQNVITRMPGADALNVLIVGVDSISRLNLLRQMPKTEAFLKNMSAFEFLGYNKVEDNTFPNLMPVLCGMSADEIANACWKNNSHFDGCPFIWKSFKERGYTTLFAEDAAWMGIFNYQKRGFQQQPTDYYWGPFNRKEENEIGNEHKLNVYDCVGSQMVYKTLIEYTRLFVTRMDFFQRPYFGFFWGASLSHDSLNYPSLGDEDYLNLLENLRSEGAFNKTALIFMSDHGMRFGGIRSTYQGMMEERLPFLYIILPDWFKRQHPESISNMNTNARRLTTHFDLHETLKDLLDLHQLKDKTKSFTGNQTRRAYSLFEKIPQSRTCAEAEISPHWCTCQDSVEVDPQTPEILQAAAFTVEHINGMLEAYEDCVNLTVSNVTEARLHTHSEHLKYSAQDYTLIVNTNPSGALFEATVRRNAAKRKEGPGNYTVIGTISRINLYGDQSHCVSDFHLKLYCYCKDFLNISSLASY